MNEITPSMSRRWVYVAAAIWLVAVTACMALLWRYKSAPGEAADPPATWPTASAIPHSPQRATLVMFAHPECPCTSASLDELAIIMARIGDRVRASVVFVQPPGAEPGWDDTETRRRAEGMPGVTVIVDTGGREAERFRAKVSGQVVLYDAAGVLRFAGGITGSRGHVGDNLGRERVLSVIESGTTDAPTAYVFGCALFGEARK